MSAELHVFGQLVGFQLLHNHSSSSRFADQQYFAHVCVEHGPAWQLLAGQTSALTASSDGVWSHPIDLHLACDSIQGWPRLRLQVFCERLTASTAAAANSSSAAGSATNNAGGNNFAFLADSGVGALSGLCTPYAQGVCYLPATPGRQVLFVPLTHATPLGSRPSAATLLDQRLPDPAQRTTTFFGAAAAAVAATASANVAQTKEIDQQTVSASTIQPPPVTSPAAAATVATNSGEAVSPLDVQLESRMLVRLDLFIINRHFKRFGVVTH